MTTEPSVGGGAKAHKAFISYSHAADDRLAPTLQASLHRFANPFYRLRALRIFRDKTSLHLTPELWPLIRRALADSEFFILLASAEAARSPWVRAEVDEWLRLSDGSLAKLLVVLTDGELIWDGASNDFDWTRTTALPPNLRAKFQLEPLHLDLRWAKKAEDLSLRHPRFLDDLGTLAAVLHGKPKDELIGKDVEQHRRFKLVTTLVVIALVALTAAALGAAYYANERRKEAVARQLAAQSLLLAQNSDQRSIVSFLLALESLSRLLTHEGARALQRSATLTRDFEQNAVVKAMVVRPDVDHLLVATQDGKLSTWRAPDWVWDQAQAPDLPPRILVSTERGVERLALSFDGRWAAVASFDDVTWIVEATTGKAIGSLQRHDPLESLAFSGDGHRLATVSGTDETVRVWNPLTGREVWTLPPGQGVARRVALNHDGKLLAACGADGFLRVFSEPEGKELYRQPQAAMAEAIGFSPDGKYLATANGFNTHVLDARTGSEIDAIGIGYPVHALAFSRDSQLLAVGSEDGAGVWNLRARRMDTMVEHPTATGVVAVAFSSDNKWLFTAGDSEGRGIIKSWLVSPADVLQAGQKFRLSVMGNRTFTPQEWRQYFGEEPQPLAGAQ